MWIKEIPKNYLYQSSSFSNCNFLWNSKNVYVMDNHLSAAWCWLQNCDHNSQYNFMHIDRHYDMLENFKDSDLISIKGNPHLSFDEFINLKREKKYIDEPDIKLLQWDNYIMTTYVLYKNWFHTNIFFTHKCGSIGGSWGHKPFKVREEDPLKMLSLISQYIEEPSEYLDVFEGNDYLLPWIVNLDIDVFFTEDPRIQLYSDEYIRFLSRILNKNLDKIKVLTIALSPDCVAGINLKEKWETSFRILRIMADEIPCLKDLVDNL